jgi:hypothetical protein
MKKRHKKFVYLFLFLLIVTFISCERNKQFSLDKFDCSDCYQEKPDSADLTVKVTINNENPRVPLVIYKGKIEDQVIDYIDTAINSDYYLWVKVDEYYSVEAKYKSGNKTIIAVDGDKIKTKKNSTECDETCYRIKGGYINVRLRTE